MRDVVVVEAVRTPIGRRNGALSAMHSVDLLAGVLRELITRSHIDPAEVGQVIGGCVSQVGPQAYNVTRTAWLTAGLPQSVAACTVDSACGSSQQAATLAAGLVAAGVVEVAVACGVEVMSAVPMGSSLPEGLKKAVPKSYFDRYEYTTQYEAAERIAEQWGLTRHDLDEFGCESQRRLSVAWKNQHFAKQIVPIEVPTRDENGAPNGATRCIERDEGLRETTLEGLSHLKPVARPDGFHTAGTSSQISDGAGAVLFMTKERARALSVRARAQVLDSCLIGSDPVLMLTGPIDATRLLLQRTGTTIDDIDVVEINEAFASVVVAWERELKPDPERVNPNGGAIAHGHPLGGTGSILLTKALHELERTDQRLALVTMCCGGGQATGTLIERI